MWIYMMPRKMGTFMNARRAHAPVVELLARRRKLHLGCGFTRLPDFVNVDCQATSTTDGVQDCSDLSWLPPASCDEVYSHAFMEHLTPDNIVPMLQCIRRGLTENGFCVMLGIPDFEEIAKAYLRKAKGNTGDVFDLREVYRYTHGDPTHISSPSAYLAQLHKTLFDIGVLEKMIADAGFSAWRIVRYRWADEPNAITFGFMSATQPSRVSSDLFLDYLSTRTPFVRDPQVVAESKN